MSIETVLFIAGVILLFVAAFDGGMELKGLLTLPKVGPLVRVGAGILGAVFILLGIWLSWPSDAPSPSAPSPSEGTISFEIEGRLYDQDIEIDYDIYFDGRPVGELKVDKENPSPRLTVTVPSAGTYEYRLSGYGIFKAVDAGERSKALRGTGDIAVRQGSVFYTQWNPFTSAEVAPASLRKR